MPVILSETTLRENTANYFGIPPKRSASENIFRTVERVICHRITAINAQIRAAS